MQAHISTLNIFPKNLVCKLIPTILDFGFIQYKSDYSLFIKKQDISFTVILVYIDDLILASINLSDNHIKFVLDKKNSIKDLGYLKYFFGFEITRHSKGLSLYQIKYCLDLLQDTSLFIGT